MTKIVSHVLRVLKKAGVKNPILEVPPDDRFGDYAFGCFILSKELRKAPNQIAVDLEKKVRSDDVIEGVKVVGPYLNFFIKKEVFLESLKTSGVTKNTKPEKVVVEYSSPNTNKPLHLGHVRNIVLGESTSRLLEEVGNKVIRSCLVNDRGIHISKSMLAYQKWGDERNPDKKTDHFVGDWYVRYNKEAEKNPDLEEEAFELLRKWEAGDKKVVTLWKKMNSWVYKGFDETYKKLGIIFDKTYYESDHFSSGKEIVKNALSKKIFVLDDKKNITVPLSKYGFDNDKVVLRADGTGVYLTQDIYLAKKKLDDYKYDKSIYVVGSEQKLHFEQLFKTLDLLGLVKTKDLFHLSYGLVYLPDGKMKSREGVVVDADDIISEMTSLAVEEINKRHKLSKAEVDRRADIIGLAALKFFILKHDPLKDMTYDPKESISFEGETGPYIQYSYARIKSILRKAKISKDVVPKSFSSVSYKEYVLAKKLLEFSEVVSYAASNLKPSSVARYLIDLAQIFNTFYINHRILGEEKSVYDKRIFLIQKTAGVLKEGLSLLGVSVLEEM
ncbi:arginine--tRNA ligase [Candidatus Woesearchaeota archaeon]|nr:arginine--tRNA ligase [Candidatus Woesearchaeota archaeon]